MVTGVLGFPHRFMRAVGLEQSRGQSSLVLISSRDSTERVLVFQLGSVCLLKADVLSWFLFLKSHICRSFWCGNLVLIAWIRSEILLVVVGETSSDLFASALPFWLVWPWCMCREDVWTWVGKGQIWKKNVIKLIYLVFKSSTEWRYWNMTLFYLVSGNLLVWILSGLMQYPWDTTRTRRNVSAWPFIFPRNDQSWIPAVTLLQDPMSTPPLLFSLLFLAILEN